MATDKPRISVYVDKEVLVQAKKLAKAKGVSLSKLLGGLLQSAIEKRGEGCALPPEQD